MSPISVDPGSFRDPGGQVYFIDDKVYRTVNPSAVDDFDFVESTGLMDELVTKGWLVESQKSDPAVLGTVAANSCYVIEHPLLPFISYPYEWPFPSLKAAALLHLDIQLTAIESNVTLSDASAFNIQFIGSKPIFIDRLSFVRYREGQIWEGHRQFCEQFLNPLLLRALFGIEHNAWYRGTQEGISTIHLKHLLRWKHMFSWNVLTHIVLQSILQEKTHVDTFKEGRRLTQSALPRASYKRLLHRLKDWIQGLKPADNGKTLWQDYAGNHSYAPDEVALKKEFIVEFTAETKPGIIWDFGCNSGEYTIAALGAGAKYAIGFDFDQGALEVGTTRALEMNLPLQFLFLDASNPPPNQGWAEEERMGLKKRASIDAVIALAFIHHMVIAKNIPLVRFVNWLIDLAPSGVVEFVPKTDSMVQRLLMFREDIFPDYTEENFLVLLSAQARIAKTRRVSESGRLLVWYHSKDQPSNAE